MTNYVQLLCREINSTKDENKTDQPLEKVFFCSGTPSLVPPKLVNSVLETLRLKFGYTPGEFPLPSETRSAEFYKMASRTLSDITANTI
ncbi:hypothetical protein ACFX2C_038816 [Malus domestica]